MTLTYADGQPLESGDAALLRELKQAVKAARSRYVRSRLTQDFRDIQQAKQTLLCHARMILNNGADGCDMHGEVVVGWEPATMTSPREAKYQPCPTCAARIDNFLGELK